MGRRLCAILLPMMAILATAVTCTRAMADEAACECRGYASIVAKVLPSVVNLSVVKVQAVTPSGGETSARRLRFFGTGFVIDPAGIIVTNRHVIQDAVEITVRFADGTQVHARLIAADRLADLAVLKVDMDHSLPALRFADSAAVRIGNSVLAIGNPYGLGTSVSHGIISGLNRNLNQTPFDDDIQTDAAINPGNSGGPLVDRAGEVIGVDTALYTQTGGGDIGIGYAIPSNDVAFAVKHLLDPNLPPPGWVGIAGQDVTPEIARAFGLPQPDGIIVRSVEPGSPAQQAGIRVADILLKVDGNAPIDTRALIRSIVEMSPGRKLDATLWRDHAQQSIALTVGAWPDMRSPRTAMMTPAAIAEMAPAPDLGMGLATITPAARSQFDLPASLTGVLIVLVSANTEANERGLKVGDVVINVNGVPVHTPDEVQRLISQAFGDKQQYLAFLIREKTGLRWVTFYTGTQPSG